MDPLDSKAIVSHYAGLEAANFAAFNECNSANEKIAAMQKQIRSLQVRREYHWEYECTMLA